MANTSLDELDKEWLNLARELMESDISKNDFRVFLELKRSKNESKKSQKQGDGSDVFLISTNFKIQDVWFTTSIKNHNLINYR